MDKNVKHYPLAQNVEMPQHCAFAVRDLPQATVEQRERALNATHWNEFSFPSGLLTVDMLSDSGTTAMTNQQWATLFLGDEAYGRNTGYYVLLDTFRDIFERGGEKNWKKSIDLVRTDCRDLEKMMDERHAKRRLTSPVFMEVYDSILKPDGVIEFKTDNRGLFEYSLESIPAAGWDILAHTFDLHRSDMAEGNVMTEYETKFASEGKPICKLVASRSRQP